MTHAYLKSRPNLANHPTKLLWGLGLIAADEWQKRRYARTSNDPWKLTDAMTDEARKILSNIYDTPPPHAQPQAFGLGKLWTDMMTFNFTHLIEQRRLCMSLVLTKCRKVI